MNNKVKRKAEDQIPHPQKDQRYSTKPRLSVFRSNSDIYAQLIDDDNGVTLAAASSREKDIPGPESNQN